MNDIFPIIRQWGILVAIETSFDQKQWCTPPPPSPHPFGATHEIVQDLPTDFGDIHLQ